MAREGKKSKGLPQTDPVRLHKPYDDNLRLRVEAHGRTPSASSAGGINYKIAKPFQSIIVPLIDPCGNKSEEKNLALVSVAGKLERDSLLLGHL